MTPSELKRFLQEWDDANRSNRAHILNTFTIDHQGKTSSELEEVLSNSASLFFTRLTAWLRLTYMNGTYLNEQLRCLLVFIGSSNGYKFLTEFIEVGGILTLLEILGVQKIKEVDKAQGLKLLAVIASTGRKYKELLCESFGVKALCECLAKSKSLECQESCRIVLVELATGNPKFLQQVYKSMIMLLKSASPEAQKIAAQILQMIQPLVDSPSISILDPALMLLQSLHVEVQYEGCLLIKLLVEYASIRKDILQGLVALLKPSKIDLNEQPEVFTSAFIRSRQFKTFSLKGKHSPLPAYIQQAVAAKLIGNLSREDSQVSDMFLKLECITNLVYAMSNEKHADSQKQAGLTLQHFIHEYAEVENAVRDAMGQTFFFEFMNNTEDFYLHLTPIQLDILCGNKVMIEDIYLTIAEES